jgi:cytochrome c oxidase subunit 2
VFCVAALALMGGAALAQSAGQQPSAGDLEGGLWLPWGASTHTPKIDFLYKVIFWVTGAMFLLVEGLIVVFCIVYRRRPGHRPTYTHGNQAAELTWTIIPAFMLLGLAIWQIPTWNEIKKDFPKPGPGVTEVDVLGEQFNWNYRYRGTKGNVEGAEEEDVCAATLHAPFGDKVVCHLRSKDVIHSFFIPHMRAKQDTVPGMRGRLWFEPVRFPLIKLNRNPDGTPGAQEIVWVTQAKDFEPGGQYYDKRVAVGAGKQYTIWLNKDFDADADLMKNADKKRAAEAIRLKAGMYAPLISPKGEMFKQKVLHQGKVQGGQAWESCDYAVGLFEIACAELCGLQHFKMKSWLIVEPRASYRSFLEDEAGSTPPVWQHWKE